MSTKIIARIAVCSLLAISSVLAWAQGTPSGDSTSPKTDQSSSQAQNPTSGSTAPDSTKPDDKKDKTVAQHEKTAGTSNDRLFYTLPNFLTIENVGQLPPMTTKQKFAVVTRGSFDYIQVFWYGLLSGINQAEDSEPGFGQGAAGYGKRFAASFADGTIENYMTGAIFPSLLHQDPRYYQSGKGSFMHRTFYAVSRNLITRSDSGGKQFNFSEVLGGGLSAAISTYGYHPKSKFVTTTTPGVYRFIASDRTLSNTAKVWGTQYAYDTMTLAIKEFWPDIRRAIHHEHKVDAAAAQPAH